MFTTLAKVQLKSNQSKLYSNNVRLVSESTSTTLNSGTPETTTSETVHWQGKGSIQYVRPRIQKSIADLNAGTMEDPVSVVCYVPYEAKPDESMVVEDIDGALGSVGARLKQSRPPANVGGLNVYWELYLGEAVNA